MYELTIDLEDCISNDEVIVRAWVDALQTPGLASEVELPLSKQGDTKWAASFSVPGEEQDDAGTFMYRVGVVAQPGASWSLRIRESEAERTLLEDGDVLTTRKEWLLGTCDTQG